VVGRLVHGFFPDSACQIPAVRNGADVKWSFRVATIAGIEVRIHATFVLVLGLFAWTAYVVGPGAGALERAHTTVVFFLLLFLCVLLHEFGHAFAARAFGIRTPDITLLPIGGLARLERMPTSPWQEFVIAVAGPAVNVVIVAALLPFSEPLTGWQSLFGVDPDNGGTVQNLLKLNCVLIVFNMIPAFPMDGGRVLRALLAMRIRHALATLIAARIGQGLAVLFVLSSFIWQGNLMLLIIGFFIFLGAQQELLFAQLREAARNYHVGEVMLTQYATLLDTMPLEATPDVLLGSNQDVFPIVSDDLTFQGFVERDELLEAARHRPGETPVGAIGRLVEPLHTETGLETALEVMQKIQRGLLPVVNARGQLVGLVAFDQLVEISRSARPD
jgi:Zn-dependent protease